MPIDTLRVLFPHQLYRELGGLSQVALVEDPLFFNQYAFHRQKLQFHRASMRCHADHLKGQGLDVSYFECQGQPLDALELCQQWAKAGVQTLFLFRLHDDWLERKWWKAARSAQLEMQWEEAPQFLLSEAQVAEDFSVKSHYRMASFYMLQRRRFNLLMDGTKPLGGKWSFDEENRLPYPKDGVPPALPKVQTDEYQQEAESYVNAYFPNAPGAVQGEWTYACSREGALEALHDFAQQRLWAFGRYEDAIQQGHSLLHHSLLTPYLNAGLLSPAEVLDAVLEASQKQGIGLNETEGFVRQIIGWREFIRGVYHAQGPKQRTRNYWGFSRKIPASFYAGNTGIDPLDAVIKRVLNNAYCHHIERLMVLSNFMLLCEFDPDEVYRWFMELFIDAYDWVMVPNVYGMGQFADGGLMSTKPYISGSAYLLRMSNFSKGPWCETWDALYWRFIHVHRDFFLQNPRMGVMVKSFDRMSEEKRSLLLQRAETYLDSLSQHS